jgi:hypothetical protein
MRDWADYCEKGEQVAEPSFMRHFAPLS